MKERIQHWKKLRFGLSRTLWCAQQEWPV